MNTTPRKPAADKACPKHPAYEADYCPVCGTTTPISERNLDNGTTNTCTINASGVHSYHRWPYTHCSACGAAKPGADKGLTELEVSRAWPEPSNGPHLIKSRRSCAGCGMRPGELYANGLCHDCQYPPCQRHAGGCDC